MLMEQLDCRGETQNKSVVLAKFKDHKQVKKSESRKDFEQYKDEPKNKILEMISTEFVSANENVLMCVGEVSDSPKRRRGRPRKGLENRVSQGKRQIVVGKDENGLKTSRAKLRQEVCCQYKNEFEKGKGSPDSELVILESIHNGLSNPSLLHRSKKEGRFKILGKRSNSERRINSSDLTTVESERLSQEIAPNEIAETAVSPKTKRGCLSKGKTELISHGSRKGFTGMDSKLF